MKPNRPLATTALFGVMAMLVLALSACGGGGASAATGTDANARDTARLKLQQCLRENGVELPARRTGGSSGSTQARRPSSAEMQKMRKAIEGPCKKFQSTAFGNITPEQRQEFQDAFVKFSSCMRKEGIDLPTPGAGGTGGQRRSFRMDRNNPKFEAAMKKCRSNLPNSGEGGGPGGGGPGGGGVMIGPPPGQ